MPGALVCITAQNGRGLAMVMIVWGWAGLGSLNIWAFGFLRRRRNTWLTSIILKKSPTCFDHFEEVFSLNRLIL